MQVHRFKSASHTIGRGFFLTTVGSTHVELYIESPGTIGQIDSADLARALREGGITAVDRALDAVAEVLADKAIQDRPVLCVLSTTGELIDSWVAAAAGARSMQQKILRLRQSAS